MVLCMTDQTAKKLEENIFECVDAVKNHLYQVSSESKRMIRRDVYTTQAEAEERAKVIGCVGSHSHDENGNLVYMPCESHDDYRRLVGRDVSGYGSDDDEDDDKKESPEFLQISAEIKASIDDDERGSFEGYGSIFGNVDLGNDVIQAGAFQKSIKKTGPKGVKLLYQHKTDMPIGVFESIEEDQKGLKVKGRLAMGTQAGRETYELMKMGALDGLSIGFKPSAKGASYDPKTRRRMIKEVELMEISVVTFPMNPRAKIRKVKGQDVSIREWENGLRDAFSLSRSEAKIAAKAVQDAFCLRDAEIEEHFEVDAVKQLTQKLKSLKED